MDGNSPPDVITKRLRTLRNSRDYQKRKLARSQEQLDLQKCETEYVAKRSQAELDLLQDKLIAANDQMSELHRANQQSNLLAQKHKNEAAKSSELLSKRTERFLVFRARKEDELRRVKVAAARRMKALGRRHHLELSTELARTYNMQRSHVKEIVGLENKIMSLQKSKE